MDIEEIVIAILNRTFRADKINRNEVEHYCKAFLNEHTFFVEYEGDFPAGISHVMRFEDANGLRAGYIYGLYVLPEYRRLGIGRGLISDTVATLFCENYDYLVLIPHNLATKRWYEKIGFRTINDTRINVRGYNGMDLTKGKGATLPAMYYALHDNFDDIVPQTEIIIPKPKVPDLVDFDFILDDEESLESATI